MSVIPAIIDSLIYDEFGGSSPQTIQQGLIENPSGGANPDSLDTAGGSVNVKDRHSFTVRIFDFSHFTFLKNLAIQRKQGTFTFVHSGSANDVWAPMNVSVVPVFPIADMCNAWIAAAGTIDTLSTSDPTTDAGNWTDLGKFIGTPNLNPSPTTPSDGCGDPIYRHTDVAFDAILINSPTVDINTTLDPFNRAVCDFAIEHSDGTYLRFKNFLLTKNYAPGYDNDGFLAYAVNLTKRVNDIDLDLLFPTTPPNFIYAFDLTISGSGVTESAYLTKV